MTAQSRRYVILLAAILILLGAFTSSYGWANDFSVRAQPASAAHHQEPQVRPGGALDSDCRHVGSGLGGSGYQFIVTCPGRARSPDRRWMVVQPKGEASNDETAAVQLSDGNGHLLDDIPALSDGMPFVLFWSPRSNWFFANHYLGSDVDRLRVFQIVNRMVIERSAVFAEAARVMAGRYPCLKRHATIDASGWRWSRDGRHIALVAYARPDACLVQNAKGAWVPAGNWEPLWMIGDVETGRIDPASVRVRKNGIGSMPKDGPYARL